MRSVGIDEMTFGTKEEQRRESAFDAIYTEAWRALKAEAQQQVKPTSSSIDTFI